MDCSGVLILGALEFDVDWWTAVKTLFSTQLTDANACTTYTHIFLFKKHWIKKLKDQWMAGCVLRWSPTLSCSIDELSSVSELSSGENEPGPLLMTHNIRTSEVSTWWCHHSLSALGGVQFSLAHSFELERLWDNSASPEYGASVGADEGRPPLTRLTRNQRRRVHGIWRTLSDIWLERVFGEEEMQLEWQTEPRKCGVLGSRRRYLAKYRTKSLLYIQDILQMS